MKLELQKGSRSRILAAIVLIAMAVFVVRLFYLQIIQHSHYVQVANSEQIKRLTIPAKRGVIYALDGKTPVPLAMNQTIYTVFADPQTVENDDKIIEVLKRVAGGNVRPDLKSLLDKVDSRYQILATRITRTQADKIKAENLAGIGFQEGSQRVYPEGGLAAQTLGFVDYSGIGRYGVEGSQNDKLTGTDGLLQSVTDVRDVPLTIGNNNINRPAINGKNIVLTIDSNVQSYAEQALAAGLKRTGATRGSVLVMNPQTGQVMAMANLPSYDPATFNTVSDPEVFNNPIVSEPYEPGSVIKTLTMTAGIEKNAVSPTATYVNTDHIRVEDSVISNATLGQTGTITFQHALNWSLNTGFVTVLERLGDGSHVTRQARDTLYSYFHDKFRLGQLTGIEVSGESPGIIIPPTDVQGGAVRYATMAFGQGMNTTMIQVASAFSAIVSGGVYHSPTVLAGEVKPDGTYVPDKIEDGMQIVSKSAADQVREMTVKGRSDFFGYTDKQGYMIGGKTGTSQVPKDGGYSKTESIGSYVGFGGDTTAKYVIMVQVSGKDRALQGARDAQPIFTDISNWMIDYLKLQPRG